MTRKRSSGSPSAYRIDCDFQHQVALPDDICTEKNFTLIRRFTEDNGLFFHVRRVLAVWPDRRYQSYRLHCFAERASAELFQGHFGGDFFDPPHDREGGKRQGAWRRQGVFMRLLESGPLKVPAMLRD